MNDPWTWTTGWGLTVGGGEQGRAAGEIGTTVIEQQYRIKDFTIGNFIERVIL